MPAWRPPSAPLLDFDDEPTTPTRPRRQRAARPWYRKKRFVVPVVVLGLAGLGAAVGPPDEADRGETAGSAPAPSTTAVAPVAIESSSDNDEHPPPADINSDFACFRDELGAPSAGGTVTNRSSETSTYLIFVVFEQAGVRVADSRTMVSDLQAGQTAQWESPTFQRVDGDFTCRVQEVERLAT